MTEVWTLEQYARYQATGDIAPVQHLDIDAPEDVLDAKLVELCKAGGYLTYHTYKSTRSTPGWPDRAIVHPDGGPLYLWELKRDGKEPSPAQRRWLDALAKVTYVATGVYTPRDWSAIVNILTGRGQS